MRRRFKIMLHSHDIPFGKRTREKIRDIHATHAKRGQGKEALSRKTTIVRSHCAVSAETYQLPLLARVHFCMGAGKLHRARGRTYRKYTAFHGRQKRAKARKEKERQTNSKRRTRTDSRHQNCAPTREHLVPTKRAQTPKGFSKLDGRQIRLRKKKVVSKWRVTKARST